MSKHLVERGLAMVARQSCIASPSVGFFSCRAQLLCLWETRVYGCLGDLWTRAPYVRIGTSACSGCTQISVKSRHKICSIMGSDSKRVGLSLDEVGESIRGKYRR
jgi:hypothetical protein